MKGKNTTEGRISSYSVIRLTAAALVTSFLGNDSVLNQWMASIDNCLRSWEIIDSKHFTWVSIVVMHFVINRGVDKCNLTVDPGKKSCEPLWQYNGSYRISHGTKLSFEDLTDLWHEYFSTVRLTKNKALSCCFGNRSCMNISTNGKNILNVPGSWALRMRVSISELPLRIRRMEWDPLH
jgi:hypothetical protein